MDDITTDNTDRLIARRYYDAFYLFLESKYAPYRTLPIHIGRKPIHTTPYILYNPEQLTRKVELEKLISYIQENPPKELWDYSQANCDILKLHNIVARYVPLRSPDWYVEKCKAWRAEGFKYDIGFCGSPSKRRIDILNAFVKLRYKVAYVCLWGDERDKALAQCKIHLNIHTEEDFQIFESARCDVWLRVGVPIVSEISLDSDSRCINVPYDQIVETTVKELRKSF